MKTKHFFTALLCTVTYLSFAQNVQSDALATSGGLNAGTTTSGVGGNTFYGNKSGSNTGNSNHSNTYIGSFSGANSQANSSIFIGNSCGSYSNGLSNIFIGNATGNYLNGSNNLILGGTIEALTGSNNVLIGLDELLDANIDYKLIIDKDDNQNPLILGDFAQNQLKFNAKVGVGYGFGNYPTMAGSVNISNYNLFVKGGILTEELRVSLTGTWADYVFSKDYNLPSLKEVENHIKEKGHLINVPSAKEVAENGLELGNIAKIQQEKIEELTLYIIEQNKINEKQNQEIEELKILVKQLLKKNK